MEEQSQTQENKQEKPDRLTALLGAEKAAEVKEVISTEVAALRDKIADLVQNYFNDGRARMLQLVQGDGEPTANTNKAMRYVYHKSIDMVACDLLSLAASTQSSHPEKMSDYVFHAVTHYEEACAQQAAQRMRTTLEDLLLSIRSSSDKEDEPAAAPEPIQD